jgi:glyoxylase-like metal-dependent hydrolase (beta-lactamase superfamily II)
VGAANAVRQRTGARVAVHPADAAYAREQGAEIDAALAVGEMVGPFRIVGVPGKSPGEVALYDPARRCLRRGGRPRATGRARGGIPARVSAAK